ncbi:hypothetical protein [Amycolatopsis alkalitolerans]|uniref:Uncharacterized protein n=1 Tax=Amycolatopsis alkalitolerans TaxID=2547244 RepID=A0A5C4MB81_9PSEU|nr:hypothetical protein [Amycolatopsis alkalitolerans]TNC28770.1 hypothetical protein FG385_05865 [Amycolatopsis alkalitolerans]
MKVAHDRRRSRQAPDALTVEDLLSAQEIDLTLVESALTEPVPDRTFLPPPRTRSKRDAPEREPESTVSKVAKLAGLTTAASLLIGAIVASSMLARARPEATQDPHPGPPQITGAAALGGFLPPAAGAPRPSVRAAEPVPSATVTSQVPAAQTQPAGGQAPAAGDTTTPSTAQATDGEKVAMVERFYRRMVSPHPEDALALLTPELAGDEPGDLVRAWSSMSEIDVDEVGVQPDGSVLAVVTMVQHDGVRLRVTQVFQVLGHAKGKDGVISRATLLSAEQL